MTSTIAGKLGKAMLPVVPMNNITIEFFQNKRM